MHANFHLADNNTRKTNMVKELVKPLKEMLEYLTSEANFKKWIPFS